MESLIELYLQTTSVSLCAIQPASLVLELQLFVQVALTVGKWYIMITNIDF